MLAAGLARRRCRWAMLRGDALVPVPRAGAPVVPTGDAPVLACKAWGRHKMLGVTVRCSVPGRGAWCRGVMLRAGVWCSVPVCKARCRRVMLGARVQSSVPVRSARCWHSDAPAVGAPSGPGPCRPPRRATAKLRHLKQRAGCPRGGGLGPGARRGLRGGGGVPGAALRSPSLSSSFSPSFFN